MKLRFLAAFLIALGAIGSVDVACTPEQVKTARDVQDAVLKGKDVACVMGSLLVDPVELAKYCKLADDLSPIVRGLIGVRDAARRSGVVYQPASLDGGADGGAGP